MYWLTGVLGLMLTIAPFILGYADNVAALWTSLLIGGGTLVLSLAEGLQKDRAQWEYWLVAILGVIAIVAPFLWNFSEQASAMWTVMIMGLLIALLAGSSLGTRQPRGI